MSHLFAPWRSEWVKSAAMNTGETTTPDTNQCLFCRVWTDTTADAQNLVVARLPAVLVMLNRYPYNAGHLLLAPRAHRGGLQALPADERRALIDATAIALHALDRTLRPEGCNLGVNQGRAAGAGIPDHVHLHVVPRWSGDTNFMASVGDTRVVSLDLAATRESLAQAFGPAAAEEDR